MKQPPHSGRPPADLLPDEIQSMLRKRHQADRVDYFATDPDPEIRTLGRLALRRDDANDLFALGDLCARRVLDDDQNLRVFYVGKTLIAYHKAQADARSDADRNLARKLRADFCDWVADCAREHPTPRNIAVALWALTDAEAAPPGDLNSLFQDYRDQMVEDSDVTHFAEHPAPAFQTDATVVDPGLDDRIFSSSVVEDAIASDETYVEPHILNNQDSVEMSASGVHLAPPPSVQVQEDEDEFSVGSRIDSRYEVVDIRRGGMGIVYLCYDHEQRAPVAIKTFQSRFLNNDRAVNRFINEAVTWVKLERHRHVVTARLVQNIAGRPHIFLEHISGEEGYSPDLRSWIDHNRLDLAQSMEFGLHIALGMQHATRKVPGLVHRDLKPANILVTHDAIAKVTDFGLVRSLEVEDVPLANEIEPDEILRRSSVPLTRVGAVVGTAPYMSPEQCRSGTVDMRSDIYAFGCLLFEMLTGRHVFEARRFREWLKAHVEWTPRFRSKEIEVIPGVLRDLTLYCLEKDPEARPATGASSSKRSRPFTKTSPASPRSWKSPARPWKPAN
jgi:tRNA A-37 threonylcarbamoyl transferase component Bud32